jgi:hypothetical protein
VVYLLCSVIPAQIKPLGPGHPSMNSIRGYSSGSRRQDVKIIIPARLSVVSKGHSQIFIPLNFQNLLLARPRWIIPYGQDSKMFTFSELWPKSPLTTAHLMLSINFFKFKPCRRRFILKWFFLHHWRGSISLGIRSTHVQVRGMVHRSCIHGWSVIEYLYEHFSNHGGFMVAGSMLSCQGARMFHKIIKAEVWLADMKLKGNIG